MNAIYATIALAAVLGRVQSHDVLCNNQHCTCGEVNPTCVDALEGCCHPDNCAQSNTSDVPVCTANPGLLDAYLSVDRELLSAVSPDFPHVYMRSYDAGRPWGETTNEASFDDAFGDEWSEVFYEQVDADTLFRAESACMVMMEGSSQNANELNDFLSANTDAIEDFVENGGAVFINAAPNEGGNISLPFGAELIYTWWENGRLYPNVTACAGQEAHEIFDGVATAYTGNWFAHASISNGGDALICAEGDNTPILTVAKHGLGMVMYGGMTTTNWHEPQPDAFNLRTNMLEFLSSQCDNPPHYYIGDEITGYWQALITNAGLSTDRIGFNTEEGQWYCDNSPTCVGFGEWNAACDDTAMVCAGGNTYGTGAQQLVNLVKMIAMGDTQHYMCPSCPPEIDGQIEMCNDTVLQAYANAGDVPAGLDNPGAMSQIEPSLWVECDCTTHHQGERFAPGSYWANQIIDAGFDESRVTSFGVQLYYDGMPSCVAFGAQEDPCDNTYYVCAGGATYGSFVAQMTAFATAIANAPSYRHPSCPGF